MVGGSPVADVQNHHVPENLLLSFHDPSTKQRYPE